jgi:hypothetical protein
MTPRVFIVTLSVGNTHYSERLTLEFIEQGPLHLFFESMDNNLYKYLGYVPKDRQWEAEAWVA